MGAPPSVSGRDQRRSAWSGPQSVTSTCRILPGSSEVMWGQGVSSFCLEMLYWGFNLLPCVLWPILNYYTANYEKKALTSSFIHNHLSSTLNFLTLINHSLALQTLGSPTSSLFRPITSPFNLNSSILHLFTSRLRLQPLNSIPLFYSSVHSFTFQTHSFTFQTLIP